jgi:hypothetical protein
MLTGLIFTNVFIALPASEDSEFVMLHRNPMELPAGSIFYAPPEQIENVYFPARAASDAEVDTNRSYGVPSDMEARCS